MSVGPRRSMCRKLKKKGILLYGTVGSSRNRKIALYCVIAREQRDKIFQ